MYKLFCIPYAGGNTDSIYRNWAHYLHTDIRLIPVEYPGHGSRISEPLSTSITEMAADIFDKYICPNIQQDTKYMIYGHSMGTIVIYELMKIILDSGCPVPHTIFLSGRYSPHIYYQKERLYLLPDRDFMLKVLELGGITEDVFNCKEIIELYTPIIKNDYKIIENYKFFHPIKHFPSNIVFFISDNDPYVIHLDKVKEWEQYTENNFAIHEFSGNHFFIVNERANICKFINQTCSYL